MATITIPLHLPMFSNLRMKFMVFDNPDTYIAYRRKEWEDYRECYAGATTSAWQGDDHYHVEVAMNRKSFTKQQVPGIIVHEAVHMVQFVCEHYGIQDKEFEAYTIEYLVNTINAKLKAKR